MTRIALLLLAVGCGGEATDEPPRVTPETSSAEQPGPPSPAQPRAADEDRSAPTMTEEPLTAPPAVPPPAPAAPPVRTGALDQGRLAIDTEGGVAVDHAGRVVVFDFPESRAPPPSTVAATVVAGIDGAASVAQGRSVACAVTSDHRAVCFRRPSAFPTIGTITTTPAVVEALADAQAAALTREHVCARDGAGAVTCYGMRAFGDLRRGTSARVIRLELPRPAVQIAGGDDAFCAVLDDGVLICAGSVGHFGLGPGGLSRVNAPWPVGAAAVGEDALCARSIDGAEVACMGDIGSWYHLDIDHEDEERGPVSAMEEPVLRLTEVELPGAVTGIAVSSNHGCAIAAGAVHCWGTAYRSGRTEGFVSRPAAGLRGVRELVAGGEHFPRSYACAVRGASPICWWSDNALGSGTPGTPTFRICADVAEPCVDLRLIAREGDGAAAPADPPPSGPAAGARCRVADPSGTPLNVRAEPSLRAVVVGTVENGSEVTSDRVEGRFRRLTAPVAGWAWSDNLRCP